MPTSTSFWDHPIVTLEKALHIRKQIEALKASVDHIMGGSSSGGVAKRRGRPAKAAPVTSSSTKADGRKGKRSPAARAKMAAAQKARWAAKKGGAKPQFHGEGPPANIEWRKAAALKAPEKKRTMSPEGRARIAAAQRARWAKVKG